MSVGSSAGQGDGVEADPYRLRQCARRSVLLAPGDLSLPKVRVLSDAVGQQYQVAHRHAFPVGNSTGIAHCSHDSDIPRGQEGGAGEHPHLVFLLKH
jgi:hypothetical protein